MTFVQRLVRVGRLEILAPTVQQVLQSDIERGNAEEVVPSGRVYEKVEEDIQWHADRLTRVAVFAADAESGRGDDDVADHIQQHVEVRGLLKRLRS